MFLEVQPYVSFSGCFCKRGDLRKPFVMWTSEGWWWSAGFYFYLLIKKPNGHIRNRTLVPTGFPQLHLHWQSHFRAGVLVLLLRAICMWWVSHFPPSLCLEYFTVSGAQVQLSLCPADTTLPIPKGRSQSIQIWRWKAAGVQVHVSGLSVISVLGGRCWFFTYVQ